MFFSRTGKVIVFSTAQSNQDAGPKESAGHGLLTYYILKELDGGAVHTRRTGDGGIPRTLLEGEGSPSGQSV